MGPGLDTVRFCLLASENVLISPDVVIHDLCFPPMKVFTVVFDKANCLAAAVSALTLVLAVDLRRGDWGFSLPALLPPPPRSSSPTNLPPPSVESRPIIAVPAICSVATRGGYRGPRSVLWRARQHTWSLRAGYLVQRIERHQTRA